MISTSSPPPVIVTPPPPTISPGNYAGGAGVVLILAGAFKVIVPGWTPDQDLNIAGLAVMIIGGIHMLLQWWLTWKYPAAPPLPDVLRQQP